MRQRGRFNMDAVERLVSEHETGRRNAQYQIWNLLVLELWHQTFIDGVSRPAPACEEYARPMQTAAVRVRAAEDSLT
jgi:hypothetical protein